MSAPGEFPLLASAEAVNPVQLVVLQGVDVGDVVASCQFVVFGVYTLTTLVGVGGVACIEKGVAYAVVAAQGVAYVPNAASFSSWA